MTRWNDLLGITKPVQPKGSKKIVVIGLGEITHRREVDAARSRRWRKRNRARFRMMEARRRVHRAHLYRPGGEYYERRKVDPVDRKKQSARQRARRIDCALPRVYKRNYMRQARAGAELKGERIAV